MWKITKGLFTVLVVAAAAGAGTYSFFVDQESSVGNTFASGVIELKVDNESYVTDDDGKLVASPATSWQLGKLAGKLFFNFSDVKPGDIGEDTISLHVQNNKAWTCMAVNLTGTPENGQPEPEIAVDPTTGTNDGELQNHLYFSFWADDGDNVYETGEAIFKQGLVKDIFDGSNWPIADASHNIWGGSGPLAPEVTKYIGKAWCFGTLAAAPKAQDGKGKLAGSTNGPLVRGTGFTCDGAAVGNIVQSDGITADVSFSVAQARNNSFQCGGSTEEPPAPPTTSTLFSEDFSDCSKPGDQGYNTCWRKKWKHRGGQSDSVEACSKNADLDGSSNVNNHNEDLTTPSFSTLGYHDITLKYDRKTDDVSGPVDPQTLKVEYSVDGGSSWTTLEFITGETSWTTKSFSLSPAADNKASVMFRFTMAGQNASNHAYIDNISVTGVTP
jgi:hypothetical protein